MKLSFEQIKEIATGAVDFQTEEGMLHLSNVEIPPMYATMDLPLGNFSKNIYLGDGEKTVCVYLPWSVKTLFDEISVDDNSFIEAIKPEKKLLVFGDSITQGYDFTVAVFVFKKYFLCPCLFQFSDLAVNVLFCFVGTAPCISVIHNFVLFLP